MKTILYATGILILFITKSFSQDTITIMTYNLTYYGLTTDYCTDDNNNLQQKTEYIKTIVNYVKPDIFAVNEIGYNNSSEKIHDYLLSNVFLLNNMQYYTRGNAYDEYLTDQIFYNYHKLTLNKQTTISSYPRSIKVYQFYYNSPDLANGDTAFFYIFLAHFNAGSSSQDSLNRIENANDLMEYINYHVTNNNYILTGDLNLYSSNEKAYQILTNYSNEEIRLHDILAAGDWHDNITYEKIHTQSTNKYSNGCLAGGGLDDRFDFFLYSSDLINNTNKIHYINNSYTILGQDGKHFNLSIDYNGNNSVPEDVLNAILNNSDHTPITCKIAVNQTPTLTKYTTPHSIPPIEINTINNNIFIKINNNKILQEKINIKIYSTDGQLNYTQNIRTTPHTNIYQINFHPNKNNVYIIKTTTEDGTNTTSKILLL